MARKGQCLLPVIPVRAEPKSQSEIVTQLIYGETYSILSENSEWLEIIMDFDNYQGWISENQYSALSFESKNIVTDRFVTFNDMVLPMGAETTGNHNLTKNSDVIALAKSLEGSPYLWGGRTFMGIDCSGFVQVIHKAIGIKLPRDASQQIAHGEVIPYGEQQKGDLVFFVNENQRVHHVGMLYSQSEIIHASGSVRIDKLTKDGIIHKEKNILTHSLFQIKRVVLR